MPGVCTVILNWNQPSMTVECVATAIAQEVSFRHQVFVIDNGSTSENRLTLSNSLSNTCTLMQNEANLGFAGGMNIGIDYALKNDFKYVWLLNNDAFPHERCLAALVAKMDEMSAIAACTPLLFYPDGTHQPAGTRVCWKDGSPLILTNQEMEEPDNSIGTTAFGTALLLRCGAIKQVGAFDSRFFMYREEEDLCARLTRAGHSIAAVGEAHCTHFERFSTGGGLPPFVGHLFTRNSFLILRNHLRWRCRNAAILRHIARSMIWATGLQVKNQPLAYAIIGGVWAGLLARTGNPTKLIAPAWFELFVSKHWWGLAKLLNRIANLIDVPNEKTGKFVRHSKSTEHGSSIEFRKSK